MEVLEIDKQPEMANNEKVLKCAKMLVDAMAIPKEYWKRWTKSLYLLAVNFDITQQLVHNGPPMVKSVQQISNVNPELLIDPGCLLLNPKRPHHDHPSELLRCAKPGEMKIGADGSSMFIKTESGKWLAIADPGGKRAHLPSNLVSMRAKEILESKQNVYKDVEALRLIVRDSIS